MSVFEGFVWGDRSKLDVFGNLYSSRDPLETYEAAFLIKYFLAAYVAYTAGRMDEFNGLPPPAAVFEFYDPNIVLEFRQNFNSPGKFSLAAAGAGIALCIAAGVAIVSDDNDGQANKTKVTQQIEGGVPKSQAEIRDRVRGFVDSLSPSKIDEVNEKYAGPARQKIGVSLKPTEITVPSQ